MAHLVEVRRRLADIEAAGGRVLAISFARPEMATAYATDHSLPFPMASDPERAAYRAYGIGRGASTTIWRPSAIWQHLRLRFRGFKPGRHRQGDVNQLGGDFVIGRDGRLLLCHPSVAGDDRASVDSLVEALRRGGK